MADINKLAEMILGGVQDFVRRSLHPLGDRIKALEQREPQKGEKGDAGERGKDGLDGAAGKDGAPGADGAAGVDGKDGPAGRDGERGEKGDAGERGDKGDAGERGEKGEPGLPGKDGEKGVDGRDGAPGPQGDPGTRGEPGEKGEPGATGKDGINGKDGAPGDRGDVGLKGDPGESGRDGRDGEPGRDAPHVEVLDGIDPTKRYQRGTFAYFRGGMVRSFKATDPLPADGALEKAGWHVVVRGVAECAFEASDDERTLAIAMRMTDGEVIDKQMRVPGVVDAGIFKAGDLYDKGDGVTWDGSFWIAQRKTQPDEKPGDASGAFRMAVKKARDGLKGERGDRGAPGRDGKDL